MRYAEAEPGAGTGRDGSRGQTFASRALAGAA